VKSSIGYTLFTIADISLKIGLHCSEMAYPEWEVLTHCVA